MSLLRTEWNAKTISPLSPQAKRCSVRTNALKTRRNPNYVPKTRTWSCSIQHCGSPVSGLSNGVGACRTHLKFASNEALITWRDLWWCQEWKCCIFGAKASLLFVSGQNVMKSALMMHRVPLASKQRYVSTLKGMSAAFVSSTWTLLAWEQPFCVEVSECCVCE